MAVEVTQGAAGAAQRDGSAGEQWVYMAEDAPAADRDLLGGKGAGLAAMTQAGLPVPPAFTITTAACNAYLRAGNQFPPGLWEQVLASLKRVEQKSGRQLGDAANPLLVSVRSGARESMPGMMDTVLNLGLNDQTVDGLARQTNNERFAWDAYRRFVGMFGRIVLNVPGEKMDHVFDEAKRAAGARMDTDLNAENLRAVPQQLKDLLERTSKESQDPDFTVERGKLYMLQTGNAKRTGKATCVIAVAMVDEGLISKEEALKPTQPMHVQQALVPQFAPASRKQAGEP